MEQNKEKRGSYEHVLKYMGLFGGIQGMGIAISLLRNKLVAVLLGPDGMGLISLFNSSIKFVSDSTSFGISVSAIKNLSEAYEKGDEEELQRLMLIVRSWGLLTALLGMFMLMAAGPLLSSQTFSWGNHTLHYIFLSPVVAMMAITGVEMAILKSTGKLRNIAVITMYTMLSSLFIAVPIYFFFGMKGIVPTIVLTTFAQMVATVSYSYRHFPLSFSFRSSVLREGLGIVWLGIAFVVAGIFGSGADFIIRSYINNVAGLDMVGFYNSGYMMTIIYGGMIFTAMETDFFPRLSAVNKDREACNLTINRQIEVSLLIVSPMLVAIIIFLPIIIPLLFSDKFLPVVGLIQLMMLALYFRAIKLPVSYLTISKGDSFAYMLLEATYAVMIVPAVILCFNAWGLIGTGIAIVGIGIVEAIIIFVFNYVRYGYVISREVVSYSVAQIPIGIMAYLMTLSLQGVAYWMSGILLMITSMAFSFIILKQKTSLWNKLTSRFRKDK